MKKRHQQQLKEIIALVRSVPEGEQLLQLAKRLDASIAMGTNAELQGGQGATHAQNPETTFAEGELHSETPQGFLILLNETLPPVEAAVTLAHELRHIWQGEYVPFMHDPRASPRIAVARERILEGDARAFDEMFRAKLEKRKFTTDDWTKAFFDFQTSAAARKYDAMMLETPAKVIAGQKNMPERFRGVVLSNTFNASAAKALKGFDKILVAGLSPTAPSYLPSDNAEALADSILRLAPAATQEKVAKLERTIRTGKY